MTLTAHVDDNNKINSHAFCISSAIKTKQEDPFFTSENQTYVLKSVNELRAGKGTAHELIEAADE